MSAVKSVFYEFFSYFSIICVYTAKTAMNVLTGVSFEFQGTCPVTTECRNTTNKALTRSQFEFTYVQGVSRL